MVWSGVLGFLIGSVTVTLLQALLPAAAMESYGWRIPFLIAGPLGLVGLYIRLRLDDTPQFAELSNAQQVAKSPLTEAVRTAWRPILQVIGLMIIFNIGYYVVFTFLPSYFIKTLHFSKTNAFVSITLASLVALLLILPLAALSDRVGRRPMLIAGSVGFAALGYPLFLLLNSGSLVAAVAAHCGLAAIEAVYVSTAVAAGVELFATRVRYSGFSIGYNICVAAFGGTTPYVVTWLTAETGDNVAPAYYVVTAAIVSLATILTIRETAGRPLSHGISDQTFQSAGLQ
jgi:MHS family proline/betaine transporter-like MFS transporter